MLRRHVSGPSCTFCGHLSVEPVAMVPSVGMNLSFVTDGLSVFFGFLVAGIGGLIALYARAYFGKDDASLWRFYPLLGFFATAMMGVVMSDNIIAARAPGAAHDGARGYGAARRARDARDRDGRAGG